LGLTCTAETPGRSGSAGRSSYRKQQAAGSGQSIEVMARYKKILLRYELQIYNKRNSARAVYVECFKIQQLT
jgi:hypothetical protein